MSGTSCRHSVYPIAWYQYSVHWVSARIRMHFLIIFDREKFGPINRCCSCDFSYVKLKWKVTFLHRTRIHCDDNGIQIRTKLCLARCANEFIITDIEWWQPEKTTKHKHTETSISSVLHLIFHSTWESKKTMPFFSWLRESETRLKRIKMACICFDMPNP